MDIYRVLKSHFSVFIKPVNFSSNRLPSLKTPKIVQHLQLTCVHVTSCTLEGWKVNLHVQAYSGVTCTGRRDAHSNSTTHVF